MYIYIQYILHVLNVYIHCIIYIIYIYTYCKLYILKYISADPSVQQGERVREATHLGLRCSVFWGCPCEPRSGSGFVPC